MSAIYRTDTPPGLAGRGLIDWQSAEGTQTSDRKAGTAGAAVCEEARSTGALDHVASLGQRETARYAFGCVRRQKLWTRYFAAAGNGRFWRDAPFTGMSTQGAKRACTSTRRRPPELGYSASSRMTLIRSDLPRSRCPQCPRCYLGTSCCGQRRLGRTDCRSRRPRRGAVPSRPGVRRRAPRPRAARRVAPAPPPGRPGPGPPARGQVGAGGQGRAPTDESLGLNP